MLNLLLVEDDEFFRDAMKNLLVEQNWKVTLAPDGRAARDIIKMSPQFDAIISDVQMPFLSGIELLEWVKANKPTPFVLMTGFALVLETQKAHDLGADDFLAKPFETDDLLNVIRRTCAPKLNQGKEAEQKHEEVKFCKVSLAEFVGTAKLSFDVFVKLGERYVKIGRKSDPVPVDRIQTYKEKGLKHLYVDKEEFRRVVAFNLALAKTVALAPMHAEKKANFMRYTGEVLLERVFMNGVDEESFFEAKEFLSTSMDVLSDDATSLAVLESLNSYSDEIYAQSLFVSVYSVLIAKNMDWTSSANLFKLSLCGIFHDIGKKEIDRALLEKPRPLLTQAERKEIESHTTRGREILMTLNTMPAEVVAAAYEHHEDQLGTGYPRRVDKHNIHPFAQIVHVANLFAEFTMRSSHHPGMAPKVALAHLTKHYADQMNREAFQALNRAFK